MAIALAGCSIAAQRISDSAHEPVAQHVAERAPVHGFDHNGGLSSATPHAFEGGNRPDPLR